MPVVNADWCDPSPWLRSGIGIGMVRDGDVLRFCRISKSGKKSFHTCGVSEWEEESEFKSIVTKDRASGAVLVAGLEPHRVMVRLLESPLKDLSKSEEIWGTLLDAAIPFSLEKCQVAFLSHSPKEDDVHRCLAVAARFQDLENVLEEWRSLDLEPDLLFPEQLMFASENENILWLGENRTLFSIWRDKVFQEGGGALQIGQRDKILSRFEHSRSQDTEPFEWTKCGPDSGRQPERLEEALATAVAKSNPLHANLRAGIHASPLLKTEFDQKSKTLKVALCILALFLFLFPLLIQHQLRAHQKLLRTEIDQAYRNFTGMSHNAPGQELLLARRFQEESWGELERSVSRLSTPIVSSVLFEITTVARQNNLRFKRLNLQETTFELEGIGEDGALNQLISHLMDSGWEVRRNSESEKGWILSGRRER